MIGNAFPLSHFIRAAQGATVLGRDAWTVVEYVGPILIALVLAAFLALVMRPRDA